MVSRSPSASGPPAETPSRLRSLPQRGTRSLLDAFVELHVEQGPVLDEAGVPLGVVPSSPAASPSTSLPGAATTAAPRRCNCGPTPWLPRRRSCSPSRRCPATRLPEGRHHRPRRGAPERPQCHRRAGQPRRRPARRGRSPPRRHRWPSWTPASPPSPPVGGSASTSPGASESRPSPPIRPSSRPPGPPPPRSAWPASTCRAAPATTPRILGATGLPIGMVFVPSVAGVSHSRLGTHEPEHLVTGARVLLATVVELDRSGMVGAGPTDR